VSAFNEVIVIVTVTGFGFVVPMKPSPVAMLVPVNEPVAVPAGVAKTGVNVPEIVPAVQAEDGVMVAPVAIVNVFAVTTVDGTASVSVPPVAVPAFVTEAEYEAVGWNGGIIVPAKVASVIAFVKLLSTVVLDVGNPEAVILTDVPAGPVFGVTVIVGEVMVKVTACETPVPSVICTVCAPAAKFAVPGPPIIMKPVRKPDAFEAN